MLGLGSPGLPEHRSLPTPGAARAGGHVRAEPVECPVRELVILKPPTFLAGIKFLWRIKILWRSSPAPEPCSKASKHAADSSPETSGLGAASSMSPTTSTSGWSAYGAGAGGGTGRSSDRVEIPLKGTGRPAAVDQPHFPVVGAGAHPGRPWPAASSALKASTPANCASRAIRLGSRSPRRRRPSDWKTRCQPRPSRPRAGT
jgi:hypothetical protein